MRNNRSISIIALVVLAAILTAASARADSFNVSLDTSALSGTQVLAFGFTDGDGVVDNSATMSAFNFGGGSAVGCHFISVRALAAISPAAWPWTTAASPRCSLNRSLSARGSPFTLNISNIFGGGTPDALAMYLCDAALSSCYSNDSSSGAMLVLNLTGGTLSPSSFILTGADDQGLLAPVVTIPGTSVPEPSSPLLLLIGLAGAFAAIKLRR